MRMILLAAAAALLASSSQAQHSHGGPPTPFLPLESEPAAKLFVDDPIPHRLAQGAVLIPYRTENFRIVPVFGASAVDVSPRVGHLHVTVDDLPWHWADAGSGDTVVIVGLPPGPHKVLIEIADPSHRVIAGKAVTFTVPAPPPRH